MKQRSKISTTVLLGTLITLGGCFYTNEEPVLAPETLPDIGAAVFSVRVPADMDSVEIKLESLDDPGLRRVVRHKRRHGNELAIQSEVSRLSLPTGNYRIKAVSANKGYWRYSFEFERTAFAVRAGHITYLGNISITYRSTVGLDRPDQVLAVANNVEDDMSHIARDPTASVEPIILALLVPKMDGLSVKSAERSIDIPISSSF